MRVLIMGIAGGLGRQLAVALQQAGHDVTGIDKRSWRDAPKGIDVHEVDLRKRAAEDVFRKKKPECVVHMATVTSLTAPGDEHYRINLGGTRAVFDNAATYGVGHVIFVGRHTFYGAAADSPLYHVEEEPPMALESFPELSDLVAADLLASTALWRAPKQITTVLRMVYTLGQSRMGTLASFLRGKRVPLVLGYDPLFQFLYEADAVAALKLAIEKKPRGVFNVAGPPPVPLSTIAEQTGRKTLPLPEGLLTRMSGRFGFPRLPKGVLEHLKYPVVVDPKAFVHATGFKAEVDEVETLRRYRALGA
jgi:UDP-glucose 4-epimerase